MAEYTAAWNLVGLPAGAMLGGATGPVYCYDPVQSRYVAIAGPAALRLGTGYWAYFAAATAAIVRSDEPQASISEPLPAGKLVLVGNPFPAPALVAGADLVYTYNAAQGYTTTDTIPTGQGAWAYSAGGATLVLTAIPPC